MTIKPKLKERIIREFYEMIMKDLESREEQVKQATETGDLPIGSLSNEQEFGDLIRHVISGYTLRYLKDESTTN